VSDLDNEVFLVHVETGPDLLDICHLEGQLVFSEGLDSVSEDHLSQIPLIDDLSLLVDLSGHKKFVSFDVLSFLQVDIIIKQNQFFNNDLSVQDVEIVLGIVLNIDFEPHFCRFFALQVIICENNAFLVILEKDFHLTNFC